MSANDNLMFDTILPELKAQSQKQAISALCEYAARGTGLDAEKLASRLMSIERTESCSGIGGGIVVLHLVSKEITKPYTVFARASQKVDYDTVDGEPVDLFALVLSPEAEGPYHLQRLARITRMLRDQDLCHKLRNVDNADALQALLFDQAVNSLAA